MPFSHIFFARSVFVSTFSDEKWPTRGLRNRAWLTRERCAAATSAARFAAFVVNGSRAVVDTTVDHAGGAAAACPLPLPDPACLAHPSTSFFSSRAFVRSNAAARIAGS
jgi:hypothetical protein